VREKGRGKEFGGEKDVRIKRRRERRNEAMDRTIEQMSEAGPEPRRVYTKKTHRGTLGKLKRGTLGMSASNCESIQPKTTGKAGGGLVTRRLIKTLITSRRLEEKKRFVRRDLSSSWTLVTSGQEANKKDFRYEKKSLSWVTVAAGRGGVSQTGR